MTDWRHGPHIHTDGSVEFRLWAPDAEEVYLRIEDGIEQAMQPTAGGWYTLNCDEAQAGSRYQFVVGDGLAVPDPASRFQPEDVHGPSEVIAPDFDWQDSEWKGRPWEEAVIYELHIGAFTPEGTYSGVQSKLDHLAALGVTAIELMPLSDFEGKRGWGYDGVLPYAPDSVYGRPEELKQLVQAAHARGIMVFLDVVYNHFGPTGNYLHSYAEHFFTQKHQTPWGPAVNFDDEGCEEVRAFFIENALYWLEEFHIDGLRFDAVHMIDDDSQKHFLHELAETIHARMPADRHVHLILENEHNSASLLSRENGKPTWFTAQWNDDFHHACHVLMTGQTSGYYKAYADDTHARLARSLREGFDYQGEVMLGNKPRGEKSAHLPPLAFVNCLQNHDQIGNRALGERLITLTERDKLRFFTPMLLLAPFVPMLYMGEEWGATQPFLFFCDFGGELADAVREGRRKEFSSFPEFSDPAQRERIPDPNAPSTFTASTLDWSAQEEEWLAFTRRLLEARNRQIVPLLKSGWRGTRQKWLDDGVLETIWAFELGDLKLLANFSDEPKPYSPQLGIEIWGENSGTLPPHSTLWLEDARA